MSHVSHRALARFIADGTTTPAFEAHVNACTECASALEHAAARAVAKPVAMRWSALFAVPLEAWLGFAVLLVLVMAWPRSWAVQVEPSVPYESSAMVSAGTPDAGGRFDDAPLMVASLDGGEMRR